MAESTQLQLEQLATILGPEPAATLKTIVSYLISSSSLQTLISDLLSSSNSDQRSQADLVFNICKRTDPDSLSLTLAHLLQFSPAEDSRAMSAVLLRNQLPYLWPNLSPNTQSALKSILLSSIKSEHTTKSISNNLCDAVSDLAFRFLPQDNGWLELVLFLLRCVSSDDSLPILDESSFSILAQLSKYLVPTNEVHTVFLHRLSSSSSSSSAVKIAALNAAINLIRSWIRSGHADRFHELLIEMMRTVMEALNKGDQAMAQEALKLFIELAGTEPTLLSLRDQIVRSMLQIAGAIEALEQGTRHLAIEFVITLAEAGERAPWIMRKSLEFVSLLFPILMRMVSDVKDDPSWHKVKTKEDEDAGVSGDYCVGQECLYRLAIALGGNDIVPVALEQLPAYFAAYEWQKHNAALVALAQIDEGCSKVLIKHLEQVVAMVLNSLQDPHPHVRWSAINAIGQLSTDLGPDLQVQYHQRVLPALIAVMQEMNVFKNPRVLAHAASAVHKFSENCTWDILTPYLDGVVSQLIVLVQSEIEMVQAAALTALASVVVSCQEHFEKYYDDVIVNLSVLMNATFTPDDLLWTKSLECIRLVGMAVGKETFRDEAKKVMKVLMYLLGSQMEADDPTTSCMLQACADLCKCLGQDFLPYMSVVMPPLLQFAQLNPDVTTTSANDNSDIDESDDEGMETITLGDKRFRIKTSVLEEKFTACNMLCCYADELKEGFFPWIDQVAPTLVPLIFYSHEQARKAAVSAMPKLLLSAKLAIDKGQAQGCNETYIKKLSDYILPALVEASHKEPDTEIRAHILDAINECIQISGPLLDEAMSDTLSRGKLSAITPSFSRKTESAITSLLVQVGKQS